MKKINIISILLVMILIIGTGCSESIATGLFFSLDAESDTYIVVNSAQSSTDADDIYSSSLSGSVTIPSKYEGKDVTIIGEKSFNLWEDMTIIIIPNTITEIRERAFERCISLKKITIPNSVVTLQKSTFDTCVNLEEVVLSDQLTEIPLGVFTNCSSLKKVEIPEGVTSMGAYVFLKCTSLEEIYIPSTVTEISYEIFMDCSTSLRVYCYNSATAPEWHENWAGIGAEQIVWNSRYISFIVDTNEIDRLYGENGSTINMSNIPIGNNTPTKSGSRFDYWFYLDAEDNEVMYDFATNTSMPEENRVLYAKWK